MKQDSKLSFEKVVDWLEGRLPEKEAQEITARIAADPALQADVAWLRAFHQASQDITFEAPPATVRAQLSRRFAAYRAENRPPTWWERLTAVLKFDSHLQPATAGARSVTPTERQLVYTTAQADVALTIQLQTPGQTFNLFGQILPTQSDTPDLFTVHLLRQDHEFGFTATDEVGEFVLEQMPAGHYDLAINSDRYQILIPLQLSL
jgi:hypothetical protein